MSDIRKMLTLMSLSTCALGALTSNCPALGNATSPVAPTSKTGITRQDACLPISMPTADVLFNSPQKVFAHYFYMFPLSIDNKPSAQDYYNIQYLSKSGESGKWMKQGGFLRQRPLGVPVSTASNWRLANMENEVRMAIARGITGFTIDVLSVKEATDSNGQVQLLLQAAQAVDSRFKIVVMPDIAQFKSDADSVTKIIASVASSPAAYKLSDGRLVVTAFNAGGNAPEWWSSIIKQLNAQGIQIAFVPTFLGWSGKAAAFADLSYGFADWGTATPSGARGMQADPAAAHAINGKLYMMPVDPQQYRPKDPGFWEAGNSEAFRSAWMSAITGSADWVQIVTWSDFSESSQIEPYTDSTLARDIGTGYYDLNGYYAAWFSTGRQPAITHDVLYYFYRREPTSAAGPAQSLPVHVTNSTPEDDIELVAFLTAPGTLKITIGQQDHVKDAPAGITSFKVPLQPGVPTFSLLRSGSNVFSFQGGVQIYGTSGIPSGAIDLTYWSGSAAQSGRCVL
jgi:Glycosyl hydrolase family 71